MGGVNAMIGGGVMGTNNLGEPTMNARFNGAHGINVRTMGCNPAGHANVESIGHQNPQRGMMGRGVLMGRGVPIASGAVNAGAGGIRFNANGIGG